jgi:hypothetical protein
VAIGSYIEKQNKIPKSTTVPVTLEAKTTQAQTANQTAMIAHELLINWTSQSVNALDETLPMR